MTRETLVDTYSGNRVYLQIRDGRVVGAVGCEPSRYLGLAIERARLVARYGVRMPLYTDLDLHELRAIGVSNFDHPRHPARAIQRDHRWPGRIQLGPGSWDRCGAAMEQFADEWYVVRIGEVQRRAWFGDARSAWKVAHRWARMFRNPRVIGSLVP